MVKAEPCMVAAEEKKAKKKRKSVPDAGGPTESQAKSKKVKKKKKDHVGNAAAADDVTNDEALGKEEATVKVNKSKMKKNSEGGPEDPAIVTNGKRKKKKTAEEKNVVEVEPEPLSGDAIRVGEVKKTGSKGDGRKQMAERGEEENEEEEEEEKKQKKKKKKSKQKTPTGDGSGAEASSGGQVRNDPEDDICSEARDNGVEAAPRKRRKEEKKVKKESALEEGNADADEKRKNRSKAVAGEASVNMEAGAGDTGEGGERRPKKKRKKEEKEKGSDAVEGTEVKREKGVKKGKKRGPGVEAASSPAAGGCDGQNEEAPRTEGALGKKGKRKKDKIMAPEVVDTAAAAGGEEVGSGVKTLKKKMKKEKDITLTAGEDGANVARAEGGQDEVEKGMREGQKRKKREKRKAQGEMEEVQDVADGLRNSQESEEQPKKKKKKQKNEKKAGLVDCAERTATQHAATPKSKREEGRTGPSDGEKTKEEKKKRRSSKKREERGNEAEDEAEEKQGMAAEGESAGAPAAEEAETPQKKKKEKKGKGEDGEEKKKLRTRKAQSEGGEAEEKKITRVKADPEENAVEVVFVSEKMGNMDEVTIDQARRQALQMDIDNESRPKASDSSPCLGQWSTAQFESTSQQQKFLRLMGGFKKGSQPTGSSEGRANMALGKKEQDFLQKGLLAEFERAQDRRMDFQNKGAGLGFAPPSNKKFFIDVNARRSVQFDD